MANRTGITEVKEVISTGLGDEEILPLIELANRIVTEKLSGTTLTDAVLKDIETFFTAHLIASTKERQPQEERVEDVGMIKFQAMPSEYLRSTTFGQTVLFLDTSGLMQKASKQRAEIKAIKQIKE